MKIILLRDVPKLGKKGEVKEVADGFAYNSLFPRKVAAPATKEHVQRAEQAHAADVHAREVREQWVRDISTHTHATPVVISGVANKEGHLFKGIRAHDIVEAIAARFGHTLSEKDIVLPAPIKEAGEHEVEVRVGEVTGTCRIVIESKQS